MRTLFVGLLFCVASCTPDAPSRACVPGSTQTCTCVSGSGAQACAPDGSRWEACACAQAPAAAVVVPTAPTPAVTKTANPTPPAASEPTGVQPYKVTIVSAQIAASKAGGASWDVSNGAPDPVATVTVVGAGSGTVRASKQNDTTAPTWNESGVVTINRGDRVKVTVVDKDMASGDDPIALWEFVFEGPGSKTLRDESANSLTLKFDREN